MRIGIGLLVVWLVATGLTLPQAGPEPSPRPPSPPAAADAPAPSEAPSRTVTPKPAAPAEPGEPEADGKTPSPSPPTEPAKQPEPPAPPAPPDMAPIAETPDELDACLKQLDAIGAVFTREKPVDDAAGCGMANPVTVTRVLPDVALEPAATLRCETALSLARMTRDLLMPAARAAFPAKPQLSAITHASAYVCRRRNSADQGKISEHARGNAIDISGLRFGAEVWPVRIVSQDDGTTDGAFQRSLNAFACLYFTTVLSPGSDATHEDHLHLDGIQRKGGFRLCR